MRAGGRLVPHALLHVVRVRGDAAHQADDVADHQLDDRTGVGVRRVEHGDAVLAGVVEVDLVGADAEASDGGQRGAGVDHLAGHAGLGANAEQAHAVKRFDQLVLAQSSLEGFHFEAMVAQRLRGEGMDVFQ